jgi:hypothetical protein
MGRCCWAITRAVRLSRLNFTEDIAQNSSLEYQLYERLPIFNRDRLAAHDPHRSVTEQSFPLFPDVIGMSPIVRKLKIVPPLKTY